MGSPFIPRVNDCVSSLGVAMRHPTDLRLADSTHALKRATECQRLATLTPDSEQRRALLELKNAWIQLATGLRASEARARLRRWIASASG
jgi:hypothetical protein